MKIIDNIPRMHTLIRIMKKEGKTIGLVPTMGHLHEGHLSLVRTARAHTDVVVMSIFVNPIQFGPEEDFEKYPRDFSRDESLAREAGVDVIFYPKKEDMYPDGYRTYVEVKGLGGVLCGASRQGHFRGVTTVVAKLFEIIEPDIAYFGQKDAQQSVIIRKMAEDLNMDIDIKVLPTVREKDGLAMSSRNTYLSENERAEAVVLYESLEKAQALIKEGVKDAKMIKAEMERIIKAKRCARIDYVSIVDNETLDEVDDIEGEAIVAAAVFFGKTRLIDNAILKGMKA